MADSIEYKPYPDSILHVEVEYRGRKGLVELEIDWENMIGFIGQTLHNKSQRSGRAGSLFRMKVIRRDNY